MSKLQPIRGTHDLLPDEFERFFAIQQIARGLAKVYGYREMATPIFEPTPVFSRSLGDESDIVHKEMFTFETKGGDSVDAATGIYRRHRTRVFIEWHAAAFAAKTVFHWAIVPL